MKQVFLLFAFFGLVSFTSNAQNCSSSKAKSASVEKASTSNVAAAKLAAMDANIEERVCAKSGKVSYVKKNVCSASGKVSFSDVEYSAETAKFINVSPSKAKKDCSKTCTKAKAKGAKATKASMSSKATCTPAQKAACAKTCTKAEKAACGVKSASAVKAETSNEAKVKLVKNEN